jgi:malonate-semialdehyde dehydrogenase (acetylating)/methylmalonate-semialdehyde dehydrogenase
MKYGNLNNFIAGKPSDPKTSRENVISPVNGTVLSTIPLSDQAELDRAVQAAKKAFPAWSAKTLKERAGIFLKYYAILSSRVEEVARIMHEEMGKNFNEAIAEVQKSLELTEFACSLPQVAAGEHEIVSVGVECRIEHVPLGVVASIIPFNFPHMVPHWTIPNAVVLGNTMVVRPSREAPLSCLKIAEYLKEAGLPDGVLNIICGGRDIVSGICEHPDIAAVSFVGSTAVAKIVYTKACSNFKRALTLGSANNHLILLPDAHPDNTAHNIAASFLGCAGQRCMSACVMVAVGDTDHIITKLVDEAKKYVPGTNMSAIVNKAAKESITGFIDRAEKDGAKILLDGRKVTVTGEGRENGFYLGPTVIDHVTPAMEIGREENFGPILAIIRAKTLDEAIEIANSSPYGNGGSIFTQSGLASQIFANRIQVGMVGINVGVPVPREPFSFGGWKDSIIGPGDITGKSSIGFWTKLKKVSTKWNPDKPVNWMA